MEGGVLACFSKQDSIEYELYLSLSMKNCFFFLYHGFFGEAAKHLVICWHLTILAMTNSIFIEARDTERHPSQRPLKSYSVEYMFEIFFLLRKNVGFEHSSEFSWQKNSPGHVKIYYPILFNSGSMHSGTFTWQCPNLYMIEVSSYRSLLLPKS